jgi:uncharacterized membrane protein
MSITKCVGAVMLTRKKGVVLHQALEWVIRSSVTGVRVAATF